MENLVTTINFFKNIKKFSLNEIMLFTTKTDFIFTYPHIKERRILKLYFSIKHSEERKIDTLIKSIKFKNNAIVAFTTSPDLKSLATGFEDHSIIIWNIDELSKDFGRPYRNLNSNKNQTDLIYSLSYRHDGNYLASGSHNRSIIVWNTKPNDPKFGSIHKKLQSNSSYSIIIVSFSQCGKIILGVDKIYTYTLWDMDETSQDYGLKLHVYLSNLSNYMQNNQYDPKFIRNIYVLSSKELESNPLNNLKIESLFADQSSSFKNFKKLALKGVIGVNSNTDTLVVINNKKIIIIKFKFVGNSNEYSNYEYLVSNIYDDKAVSCVCISEYDKVAFGDKSGEIHFWDSELTYFIHERSNENKESNTITTNETNETNEENDNVQVKYSIKGNWEKVINIAFSKNQKILFTTGEYSLNFFN